MGCGRCGKALIEIRTRRLGLRDAAPLQEVIRRWEAADGEVALDEVLELARGA